jgi:hypothetical protein
MSVLAPAAVAVVMAPLRPVTISVVSDGLCQDCFV